MYLSDGKLNKKIIALCSVFMRIDHIFDSHRGWTRYHCLTPEGVFKNISSEKIVDLILLSDL